MFQISFRFRQDSAIKYLKEAQVLIEILKLNSIRKPLTLHVRGTRNDSRDADVQSRCRDILKYDCVQA